MSYQETDKIRVIIRNRGFIPVINLGGPIIIPMELPISIVSELVTRGVDIHEVSSDGYLLKLTTENLKDNEKFDKIRKPVVEPPVPVALPAKKVAKPRTRKTKLDEPIVATETVVVSETAVVTETVVVAETIHVPPSQLDEVVTVEETPIPPVEEEIEPETEPEEDDTDVPEEVSAGTVQTTAPTSGGKKKKKKKKKAAEESAS
jgi:hypothetical protein